MNLHTTRSGDYRLPSRSAVVIGNAVIALFRALPEPIMRWLVRHHSGYQLASDSDDPGQGRSERKLATLEMPDSLDGKSVIDLGCAEGYFARECAARGAAFVLGIDSSLSRLLYATSMANGRPTVRFRMDVFPSPSIQRQFDYVLCLSLLHHSLSQKNVSKVLRHEAFADDKARLQDELRVLRSLTSVGGRCILEMPYEYDDPATERPSVEHDAFTAELIAAGFSNARCTGTWEFNPTHKAFKDRFVYVAEG